MGGPPVLQVEGARELRRALKSVEDGIADLKATHAKIVTMVTGAASGRVPRRSGALAGSIRGSGTASAAIVRAGGSKLPYGNPIHWGWPARNILQQPFLTDAAKATEPAWTATYQHDVQHLIDTKIATQAQT